MSALEQKAKELTKARQKEFESAPLSRCIEMALEDMTAAKKAGVKIDMDIWAMEQGGVCYACFAGCVMLERFEVTPMVNHCPQPNVSISREPLFDISKVAPGISKNARDRFYALNEVRVGNIGEALEEMGHLEEGDDFGEFYPWKDNIPRSSGPKFYEKMEEIINQLRERGY